MTSSSSRRTATASRTWRCDPPSRRSGSTGPTIASIWPGTDAAVGRVAAPRWTPDGDHLVVSVATGNETISDIHPATLTLDGRLETIGPLTSGVAFTPRPTP